MFTGYLQEGQLGVVFEDFGWYPLYLVSTQSSTTRFISDLKQFFNVFFAVCAIFFQVHYHFELILRWIYHVALEKNWNEIVHQSITRFAVCKIIFSN